MRRVLYGLAVLALVGAGAALLFTTFVQPGDAEATLCPSCTGNFGTATMTGSGSTCSAAFVDLTYKTDQAADARCVTEGKNFSCMNSMEITEACHAVGSGFEIEGWMFHGCASFCVP